MTVLLGFLMPYTVSWLATKYHLGIVVHNVIQVLFLIDIVRRHSHPHNWIINSPIFAWWLVDRCLISTYWRRASPTIHRVNLSDDYMLLVWKQGLTLTTVGPKYFLKLSRSGLLEKSHVFTCFHNHRTGTGAGALSPSLNSSLEWDSAAILRVYHNRRAPPLGSTEVISHTHRIQAASQSEPVQVWGPFLGGMSEQVYQAIHAPKPVNETVDRFVQYNPSQRRSFDFS